MPSLYPEKLLQQLEQGRIDGPFKPDRFDERVSKNIFSTWQDLQQHHLYELSKSKSIQQKRDCLSKCLMLDMRYPSQGEGDTFSVANAQAEQRREIFLDLAVQTLIFCRKAAFTPTKTSTFFSIINTLHIAAAEMPGPPMPIELAYDLAENLLLRHGVERPPFSKAIFMHSDVKQGIQHIISTYLRHLKHYQYVFGMFNELDLKATGTTAYAVEQKFQPLDTATSCTPLQEEKEGACEDEEQPGAAEAPEEVYVDLDEILKTPEERAMFERALGEELAKMEEEVNVELLKQQKAFEERLQQLEGSRPSKGTGKK